MHHVVLEHWSRGDSVVHHVDARAKTLALLAFLIAVATTRPEAFARIAAYLAILLAGVLAARLPLMRLLARATVVLPFAAAFAAACWIAGDGLRAVGLLEKTYLSAIAVLLVVGTTPLPLLLTGFRSLGVPRILIAVVQFLYRYLFVISEQAQHMRLAASCRSGVRKADRKSRFGAAAGALSVLFARSFFRADGIHRAMLARGYDGKLPTPVACRFRAADGLFAAAAIALVAAIRAL